MNNPAIADEIYVPRAAVTLWQPHRPNGKRYFMGLAYHGSRCKTDTKKNFFNPINYI